MNELTSFTPQFRVAKLLPSGVHRQFAGVCRVLAVKERRVFNPENGGDDPYETVIFRRINGPMADGRYATRWHCEVRQTCIVFNPQLVTSLINRCSDASVQHEPHELAICHAAGMVISYPKDRTDEATTYPHVTRGTRINYASRQTADNPNKADLLKARENFRVKHDDRQMVRLA